MTRAPNLPAQLGRKTPVAPPVYRVPTVPRCLQRKSAMSHESAPPIYRPQELPNVLQVRDNPGQRAIIEMASKKPSAPSVYRPGIGPKIVQAKTAGSPTKQKPQAPPVYRPLKSPLSQRTNSITLKPAAGQQQKASRSISVTPAAPPVYRPLPTQKCLQQKPFLSQKRRDSMSKPAAPAIRPFSLAPAIKQPRSFSAAKNGPKSPNSKQPANRYSATIQRLIPANSTGAKIEENNRLEGRPLNFPTLDMGTTTEPVNARAPQYTVTVTADGDQFRATVALSQTAFEGNVESIYTNWGTYFTGHYWLSDADARFSGANTAASRTVSPAAVVSVADKDYVYMNVSRAMARLSKQAEEEHLSDFRRAFQISLQAAETAIRYVRDLEPLVGYGPYATAVDARNDIATRIHNALPLGSQGLNVDQTQWLTNYLTLCQRSKYRDGQNWHSFDIAESSFWYNSRFLRAVTETWDIYAEHPETQVHYVDVTPGPSIAVGTHTSATVIHF